MASIHLKTVFNNKKWRKIYFPLVLKPICDGGLIIVTI